jgi:zinc D-Ala-D-Ala carboxypeptidase
MTELRYFKLSDFDCQETGENEMNEGFLHKLDHLRHVCGFPFYITSGYRSPNHSIERAKRSPGTHAQGIAADIAVSGGAERMQIIKHAAAMGFTGIGVAKGFVHVDVRRTVPVAWCY